MDTKATVNTIYAVSEAVRTAGEIPNGHLYAMLCGTLGLEAYNSIIKLLVRAGLVSNTANLLRWIGPQLETPPKMETV